ncbi:MAG: AAA family ATPase [Acidimicrobiia bacterium]|nr:AAA family ATPase [Acidimicrobiia bacterium]
MNGQRDIRRIRDEILRRADLRAVLTELTDSAPQRQGAREYWRCPFHDGQTGKTQPLSMDIKDGIGLWRCQTCGEGGTAIDLFMRTQRVDFMEALRLVARAAGTERDLEADLYQGPSTTPPQSRSRDAAPSPGRKAKPDRLDDPHPTAAALGAIDAYVTACQHILWSEGGRPALEWLRRRGLTDETIRTNRLGADLGSPMPERVPGIPRPQGPGAVFPILDSHGRAIYLQIRNGITETGPRSRAGNKYLNPRADEFGRCPRACWPKTTGPTRADTADVVLICEGLPDTLTAAQAGFKAVGLLGTGHSANTEGAASIVRRHVTEKLVLALDNDDPAERALPKLAAALHEASANQRTWRLHLPTGVNDLNDWHLQDSDFADHLAAAVRRASPLGWGIPHVTARLPGWCATLADHAGVLAIQTSFPTLDEHLAHGGWRPGIHLFGGCPGVGKSAFATQCALHAARADHPVLYVSIEQPPEDLIGRIFCKELGVSIDRYWNREPSYLALARQRAPGLPLHNLHIVTDPALVRDTVGTAGRIRAWTETLERQTGARPLVIIDYLQEMRPPDRERSKDERIQIARSGLTLRQLARDMGVPVIVISSINRVSYQTTPNLAAFKGSGDLEYQADTALLLRVRAASDEEAAAMTEKDWHAIPLELHLVKNRYGRITGQHPIPISFDRQHGRFREEQDIKEATSNRHRRWAPDDVPEHLRFGSTPRG